MDLGDIYPIKRFVLDHDGGAGQEEIIAAVEGKVIVVMDYVLNGDLNDGTAIWQSADTALSGTITTTAEGTTIVAPYNPKGWIQTAAGEALNLTTSGTSAVVSGHGSYVEVG